MRLYTDVRYRIKSGKDPVFVVSITGTRWDRVHVYGDLESNRVSEQF